MPRPVTVYKGKAGAWTASRSKCEGKGKTKDEALAALNEEIDKQNAEPELADQPVITDLYKDVQLYDEGEDGFLFEYTPISLHGRPQRTRLDADDRESAIFEAAGILNVPEDDLRRDLEKNE